MDVAEIIMSKEQALKELRNYAKPVTAEDRLISQAYKAIRSGRRLLDLNRSFRLAGVDSQGRPKLAICRADATTVVGVFNGPGVRFHKNDAWTSSRAIYIDRKDCPNLAPGGHGNIQATLPVIPPRFRPGQTQLRNYRILWEASWEDVPTDPILLKPLQGALHIIMAWWDLTPVEQSAMRMR